MQQSTGAYPICRPGRPDPSSGPLQEGEESWRFARCLISRAFQGWSRAHFSPEVPIT